MHALISTPESVYVWSYTTQHTDPVVLTFPVRSQEASLASLVSPNAGSSEPGLILLKPLTGQIAYWDSAGSAVAEGLVQRAGVQSTLPLAQGEIVTSLCNAEPAAFVASTSTGALWLISVRDAEGRPNLSFNTMMISKGAWLGGLSSLLRGGQGRSNVVSVKAGGRESRSERRDVLVATGRGEIEKWELARGGSYRLVGQGDLSNLIHKKLRELLRDDCTFSVVDVASVPSVKSSDKLVFLVSYVSQHAPGYALLLGLVDNQPSQILSGTLLPASPTDYSTFRPGSAFQPQIYIPYPGKTIFVVYSRGISIVSLPVDLENWAYCDTLTFRDDHAQLRIIGCGQEDLIMDPTLHRKHRSAGVILIIQNAGVVRCETFDNEVGDIQISTSGLEWIQSKIEQAVFYGSSGDNPLDFKPREEWNWKIHEVEKVAIKISAEILMSGKWFPNVVNSSIKVYSIFASARKFPNFKTPFTSCSSTIS